MWKWLQVLVAIGLVGALGFGQVFPRNETLYISGAAWGPPVDWNPFITWSKANTSGVMGLIYEFLFFYDPVKDELIPWLAEKGEWATPTLFRVTLRPGIAWQDGTPLTAADVVFTFELGKKHPAVYFSPMWNYLTSVTAVGTHVVEFAFSGAPLYQSFQNNLYTIAIVPQHIWKNRTVSDITGGSNEKPVGSGAYLYHSHGPDRNVYVRNENWWGTRVLGLKPAPKYIVEIRFLSNDAALGSFLLGQLDLSNNFLPGVAELIQRGYAVKTYLPQVPYMKPANTAVLFLNTTIKPMDDPAFRKALAFAINVDDIIRYAFAGLVERANPTGLLPHLQKYVDQKVVRSLGFTYDPAAAKAILAAAGYRDRDRDGFVEAPDGSKIALEVTCPFGWTDWMEAIRVIAASARAAGINVVARTPDYGVWNTALVTGTFHMTLNNWAGLSNTPWTVYDLFFTHPIRDTMSGGNFGRYNNPAMFALLDQLAATPAWDVAAVQAVCSQIQTILLTDLPLIPLWYNGLWSQYREDVWTNWPTAEETTPHWLPCSWAGYWQMGGLHTLCGLKLKP